MLIVLPPIVFCRRDSRSLKSIRIFRYLSMWADFSTLEVWEAAYFKFNLNFSQLWQPLTTTT